MSDIDGQVPDVGAWVPLTVRLPFDLLPMAQAHEDAVAEVIRRGYEGGGGV